MRWLDGQVMDHQLNGHEFKLQEMAKDRQV